MAHVTQYTDPMHGMCSIWCACIVLHDVCSLWPVLQVGIFKKLNEVVISTPGCYHYVLELKEVG